VAYEERNRGLILEGENQKKAQFENGELKKKVRIMEEEILKIQNSLRHPKKGKPK
jgi:hypothetical protein